MSNAWLFSSLIVSIIIILLMILKFNINAGVSLIIGAIILGIAGGLPYEVVITAVDEGFGDMLAGIGLPIGFGIILGKLLSDSGAANSIAEKIVSIFPKTKGLFALALTAFIISIPVFFDVTFVILLPIGIAMKDKIGHSLAQIVGAICIGAGTGFLLVPPAPNPLAATQIFDFDTGILIVVGAVIGLISVFTSTLIHSKLMRTNFWNDEKDIERSVELEESEAKKKISFFVALLPIITPIVLIVLNTILTTVYGSNAPAIVLLLGSNTFAMLLGTIVAYIIAAKPLGGKGLQESSNNALKDAGTVFLITGAGGAFAEIIAEVGISERIASLVGNLGGNFLVILLIGWLVGAVLRQVTGSGTVAALTSMGILSGTASVVSVHPVFLAAACLSGSLLGATINDSGFWIVANISGYSATGGMKTYSIGQGISSVITIIIIIAVATISSLF